MAENHSRSGIDNLLEVPVVGKALGGLIQWLDNLTQAAIHSTPGESILSGLKGLREMGESLLPQRSPDIPEQAYEKPVPLREKALKEAQREEKEIHRNTAALLRQSIDKGYSHAYDPHHEAGYNGELMHPTPVSAMKPLASPAQEASDDKTPISMGEYIRKHNAAKPKSGKNVA